MHRLLAVAVLPVAALTGCQRTTGLATSPLSRPPDVIGVVASSTYQPGGPSPGAITAPSYEVWFDLPPDTILGGEVQVALSIPVFLSSNGVVGRASASSIAVRDTIRIWTDGTWAADSQDPPGTRRYRATQIVLVR